MNLKLGFIRSVPLLRPITRLMSTSASSTESYVPPKVWKWEPKGDGGNKFGGINRPTAGARFEKELPKGKHTLQLYSLATPNGVKVTIMLEELLDSKKDAEYDAWLINIMEQDQFGSDFVKINPNSKIPALMDHSDPDKPVRLFESGSILFHLAEKYDAFFPKDKRSEVMNWVMWQMGAAPYLGGGFGHFYQYANEKMEYPIERFTMETKRQLDVLNNQLKDNQYMAGDEYTIADIAIFPWYGVLALGDLYGDAKTFLNIEDDYPHLVRWARMIADRPAVKRGRIVNKSFGDGPKVENRHEAADIDRALESAVDHGQ